MTGSGTSYIAQQAANWLGMSQSAAAAPTQLGAVNVDPVVAQEQHIQQRMQQVQSMEAIKRPSNVLVLGLGVVLTYAGLASRAGRAKTTK